MRILFLLFILPFVAKAQLKEFEIGEMPRPDVAVVQANAQWPDDALLLVYSSLDGLQFRSSMGAVDKQTYNNTAGRYEILVKPVKQMMFVAKPGFMELKIATINPNPKDVFYYKVEEESKPDARVEEVMERLSKPESRPEGNFRLKSADLKNYKYLVISQSKNKAYRKAAIKWLKKSGYKVLVNIPAEKNNDKLPSDLQANPKLALYINYEYKCDFSHCRININLLSHKGYLINSFGVDIANAYMSFSPVKRALEMFVANNQTNEYYQTFSSPIIESNSVEKLLDLKKLYDAGVISETEYNSASKKLKNEILEKSE